MPFGRSHFCLICKQIVNVWGDFTLTIGNGFEVAVIVIAKQGVYALFVSLFGFEAYKKAINFIALNYPNSPEGKQAEQMMQSVIPMLEKKTFVDEAASKNFKVIYSFTSPVKPRNANDIKPAVIMAIALPWKAFGTSATAIRSRMAAKKTKTNEKPTAAPKP